MSTSSQGRRPAFPVTESCVYNGLTIREYFAAAALQGLLAFPGAGERQCPPDNAARDAVEMADALIAALNTTKNRED